MPRTVECRHKRGKGEGRDLQILKQAAFEQLLLTECSRESSCCRCSFRETDVVPCAPLAREVVMSRRMLVGNEREPIAKRGKESARARSHDCGRARKIHVLMSRKNYMHMFWNCLSVNRWRLK